MPPVRAPCRIVKPGWLDRHGEEATCVRCLEVKDTSTLDRLFWCELCRERAMKRATRIGYAIGAVVAGSLALWIFLVIRPSRDLILGGWIAIVVAAFYLASRIAREIGYGAMRLTNRRAVEAVPPEVPGVDGEERPG